MMLSIKTTGAIKRQQSNSSYGSVGRASASDYEIKVKRMISGSNPHGRKYFFQNKFSVFNNTCVNLRKGGRQHCVTDF